MSALVYKIDCVTKVSTWLVKIFLRAVPTPLDATKISTSHPFLFEDRMTVLEVKKNITQKLLQNIEKTLYE